MTFHQFLVTAAGFLVILARAQHQPLLSTIATIPQLSTFSSVVNASGGNKLNPALEERFNTAIDGRNYTALVPTNDAFAKVSPTFVKALTAAPAYSFLEAIIRTHIAEGLVPSANIISSSPVVAIEGFSLSAAATGSNGAIFVNDQAQIVAVDTFASNGVVHQIDQVLNPFTAYFGVSNATTAPRTSDAHGTIAEILLTDQRLTNISDILLTLQPDFIRNRLMLTEPNGTPQIFAVPSNEAFSAAPGDNFAAAKSPSNEPLSFQLFAFGLLDTNARFADLNLAAGAIHVPSIFTGINVTANQLMGGAAFLNNAAIQEQVCGSNGCVWIIDRILDPFYLAFGPLSRGR